MQPTRIRRSLLSYGALAVLAVQMVFSGLPIPKAHAASGDLVINEINWAGSNGQPGDEWIELYNAMPTGSPAVDFSVTPYTLEIQDANGASLQVVTIGGANAPTLNPHRYLLIHNKVVGTTVQKPIPGAHQFAPTPAMAPLPNEPTQYILRDNLAMQVDAVTSPSLGTPPPFAGSAGSSTQPIASMERVYTAGVPGLGSDQASWRTSHTYGAYFTHGAVQFGTPGGENVVMTAPTGVSITPAFNVTAPTNPTINGSVSGNGTQAVLTIQREGPVPSTSSLTVPVNSGTFSAQPSVTPGRYTFAVRAQDSIGNQSTDVDVPVASGSSELNYLVFANSSSVPAPMATAMPGTTNQATVTASGTVDVSVVEVDVARNGEYLQTIPVSGGSYSASLFLLPNTLNAFDFVAVANTGTVSQPTHQEITHDNIAPNGVVKSKVPLDTNPPGTADTIRGVAGAAEAGTTLKVYGDAALTQLIGTTTIAADGSFPLMSIGDNAYPNVYVQLTDAAGNKSVVTAISNPISFADPANGIGLVVVSVSQNQAKIAWNNVPNAVNYKLKYKQSNGTYSSPILVCPSGSSTCSPEATLINLSSGTAYTVAVAAVDKYGNETSYTERSFQTTQPKPVVTGSTGSTATTASATLPAPAHSQPSTRKSTAVAQATATPTPSATATPTTEPEKGEVKSTTDEATRNWTPWIVLGVLLGIAALATLGYFYWFGGTSGAAVMASAEEARARIAREDALTKKSGSSKAVPPKKTDRTKRW
jgi:hypothetical protein